MSKKLIIVLLVFVMTIACLTACNKKTEENTVTYGDIYTQNEGIAPYTSTGVEIVLPTGVEPYYTTKSSSKIYSNTYNASTGLIFCQKTVGEVTYYGFYRVAGKTLIADGCVYDDNFFVNYGLVCAEVKDTGALVVMSSDGANVVSKDDGFNISSGDIDDILVPISENYVAVRIGTSNYFNFYKVSDGKKVKDQNGNDLKLFCGDVWDFKAVDNYLIRTEYTGTSTSKKIKNVYIYDFENGVNILYDAFYGFENPTSSTTSSSSLISTTTYPTRAVFYLGDGKLYCYEQKTGSEDSYQYKEIDEDDASDISYYNLTIWTYDLKTGTKETLSPNTLYTTVINSYYSVEVSRDVDSYIKKGYSYISSALVRQEDKTMSIEQYIIDKDLNVYVSMIDHLGTATKYDEDSDEFRDVMLTFVDGYGFSNEAEGDILIYDTKGNTTLKIEGKFSNVFYNNGIITATKTVDNTDYFVAYKLDGTIIVDESRGYKDLCGSTYASNRVAFVGKYALVKDAKSKIYLINSSGEVEKEITDIYKSSGQPYFYAGVYVTYEKDGSNNIYGLKNYDGKVLFENQFKNVVLDKRGTNELIFYANDGENWKVYFLG